jgi:hypothetical protein
MKAENEVEMDQGILTFPTAIPKKAVLDMGGGGL